MRQLIICILLVLIPVVSYSADESKRESVEKLFVLMDTESMVDETYSQMDQIMKNMGRQMGIKPSEQEMFDLFVSKYMKIMKSEFNWEKMKEPMTQIYLKHFSEKEIQDMIVFYNSDTGQSMIRKMPEVLRDSMLLTQDMLKDFIPKMEQMAKEIKEELATERKEKEEANKQEAD